MLLSGFQYISIRRLKNSTCSTKKTIRYQGSNNRTYSSLHISSTSCQHHTRGCIKHVNAIKLQQINRLTCQRVKINFLCKKLSISGRTDCTSIKPVKTDNRRGASSEKRRYQPQLRLCTQVPYEFCKISRNTKQRSIKA
jgi:hypothetical protein